MCTWLCVTARDQTAGGSEPSEPVEDLGRDRGHGGGVDRSTGLMLTSVSPSAIALFLRKFAASLADSQRAQRSVFPPNPRVTHTHTQLFTWVSRSELIQ